VSSTVLVIEKQEMLRLLHEQHDFSDRFIAHMLARNVRIEAVVALPPAQLPGVVAQGGPRECAFLRLSLPGISRAQERLAMVRAPALSRLNQSWPAPRSRA
jgi:hypothetical protein